MAQLSRFRSRWPSVKIARESYYTWIAGQDIFSAEHPFTINGQTGHILTRGAFWNQTRRLAYGFRNARAAGLDSLEKGATAMIVSPATEAYMVVQFALAAAGVVCALANPTLSKTELAHAVKISGASHILADASVVPLVVETLRHLGLTTSEIKRRVIIIATSGEMPDEYKIGGWVGLDDLDYTPVTSVPERFDGDASEETALIYFSSGTTGLSKGVEISHYNVIANITVLGAIYTYATTNRDVTITGVPLFHVLGGLFIPEEYLGCIQEYKVSVIITVPPVLLMFTNSPLVDKYDLSSLNYLAVGAAPVSPEMMLACKARFAKRGWDVNIGQGFGMTELSGVATFVPPEEMAVRPTSIGLIPPNMEIRVVDNKFNDVPIGSPGELWFRGPIVMKGYVNNPKATAETIMPDGWMRSGDVAVVDEDGFISIADRIKELIKYKGFQVAPAELESMLGSHPDVGDCAVIGVYSNEEATELPKAYIVPKDPKLLSSPDSSTFIQSIHIWLAPRVATYKRLRGGITLINEIPKTPSGKILKRTLRELEQRSQPQVTARL